MSSRRLRLALKSMLPSDWEAFEQFASAFLVDEFPTLWTTAHPSGDRGRDAEVFVIGSDPFTVMQYSVQSDWQAKLSKTVRDVADKHPNARRIVFCSNQAIGASADEKRQQVGRDYGLQVDLRDQQWFVDRAESTRARSAASEELAARIVDPLLSGEGLRKRVASGLSPSENRVALLQLAFVSEDANERSLTKSSFDSLVLAALQDSTAERTLSLQQVLESVREVVSGGPDVQVSALVESALTRLSRKNGPIKKRSDSNEFHLSHGAQTELRERVARYLLDQQSLEHDIAASIYSLGVAPDASWKEMEDQAVQLRESLETVLMHGGERFVNAVQGGPIEQISREDLIVDLANLEVEWQLVDAEGAADVLLEAVAGAQDQTRVHLSRVLEAYTLLAFLRATPDVQGALSHLLDGGEVWLDASAVLPLIGELLIVDPEDRLYTRMLRAALDSGITLYVSDGMVLEVERHLNQCAALHRIPLAQWRAPRVPFIYAMYLLAGRDLEQFPNWLDDFRGSVHPVEDVADSLEQLFGIRRRDLTAEAERADVRLRGSVQALFLESHTARRERGADGMDRGRIEQLAAHDVSDVVGIIETRRDAQLSPLGYTTWWLSLDSKAYRLGRRLREELGEDAPASPVLSPQFLGQMLRFGAVRKSLDPARRMQLPLMTDLTRLESISPELLEVAKAARTASAHFSEHRIRREVRDALDLARSKMRPADRTAGVDLEGRIKSDVQRGGRPPG